MKKKKVKIYIAGPLFTPGDRKYLESIDALCKDCGFDTYLPHRDGGLAPANGTSTIPYFEKDVNAINNSEIILAVLNGTDVDSGTAWELGYGYSSGKILLGIFEDTRVDNPLVHFNLMITTSTKIFNSKTLLEDELKSISWKFNLEKQQTLENEDIHAILRAIIKLPLEIDATSSSIFGYSNPVLCCIDAILSINRPYNKFVKPRVINFSTKYPNLNSLINLLELLNSMPEKEFGIEFLNYNHVDRICLLKTFVSYLVKNVLDSKISELTALKNWAQKSGVYGYKIMNIKGISIATYQYFRMLVGVNTIKPDMHITRFIQKTLGKKVNAEYCITMLEYISDRLHIEATSLDHSLWKLYALKEN